MDVGGVHNETADEGEEDDEEDERDERHGVSQSVFGAGGLIASGSLESASMAGGGRSLNNQSAPMEYHHHHYHRG